MMHKNRNSFLNFLNYGILIVATLFAGYNLYIDNYFLIYLNTSFAIVALISLILGSFPATRQSAFFLTFCTVFFVSFYSMFTAFNDVSRLFWVWPIIIFSFYTLSIRIGLIFNVFLLLLAIIILTDPFSFGTGLANNKDKMRFIMSIALTQSLFYTYEVSRKKMEHYISDLANIEISSGLTNQHGLIQELENRIVENKTFALMLIKVQNVSEIFSRTGYKDIHSVIKKTIEILKKRKTKKDFLIRTNEDSFFLVLEHSNKALIDKIGNEIIADFSILANSIPELLRLEIKLAVSFYEGSAQSTSDLIRFAKIAIEENRNSIEKKVHYFHKSCLEKWDRKNSLARFIRRGLKNEEFNIHYQPQVDSKTGKIAGVEALLRWKQTKVGIITTQELIATAEESDLIYTLGDYLIEKSLEGMKTIYIENPDIKFAINLTPRQLLFSHLFSRLEKFIKNSDIPAVQIELEISEKTFLSSNIQTMRRLRKLDKLGIRIVINDFGSGVTGGRYLTSYPISAVKIDKNLIKNFHLKKNKKTMIISMMHALSEYGIEVIPEGVESLEQVKLLREYGSSRLQGWYFSKALNLDSLQTYLNDYKPESIFTDSPEKT